MSARSKCKCTRCRSEEYIPTFQFVKFDDEVMYLCASCWQVFRRWFFVGTKGERPDVENAA